jgi:hypothetical protein
MSLLQEPQEIEGSSLVEEHNNDFDDKRLHHLNHLWTLTLQSLNTVEFDKLIEFKVFNQLIDLFLCQTSEIQQNSQPKILALFESMLSTEGKSL